MLLLLSLLVGCSDISLGKIEQRAAEILVHPTSIDFGNLVSGQESDQKYFTVINTGDADLIITSPLLISDERFYMDDNTEESVIPAGELVEFDISYVPLTFEHNTGIIQIESNDETNPLVEITVEGRGDAPVMTVDPIEFDYGDISIGCDNEERITITNIGNLPLVIDSVVQMVTQPVDILMEFGTMPELPWTIDSGLSVDFLVSYIPEDLGGDESQITITGNDPLNPVIATSQVGVGNIEEYYSDVYIQEEIPVLDVLWVVDDSGSMSRHQTNLASNINLFVNVFMSSGADYHMAVITTSDSQIGSVITSSDPDPSAALAQQVMVGITGSGLERGLVMSYLALSSSTSAGPGSSFFRNDSSLVVIYVSDEPDFSAASWYSYVMFFDSLKPAGKFIPYGVIGDKPAGCTVGPINAQYGGGYWDLIDYYGGDWYSICATDWGDQLQDVAENITSRRIFDLSNSDPVEETIEVRINGQIVSEWTYDATGNSIQFDSDHLPEPGSTIEINYAVWGCHE